jgi:hypothetical protein
MDWPDDPSLLIRYPADARVFMQDRDVQGVQVE